MDAVDKITASQAKAITESPIDFLMALPGTLDWMVFWTMLGFGVLGVLANYTFKYLRDEIAGNPFIYLFQQNFKRTALAFSSFVTAVFGMLQTNMFIHDGVFIGWSATILIAISAGMNFDAYINKGERKEWSNKERDAKEDLAEVKAKEEAAK